MDAMKGKVFENATSEWEELVTSSRRCIVKMNDLDSPIVDSEILALNLSYNSVLEKVVFNLL